MISHKNKTENQINLWQAKEEELEQINSKLKVEHIKHYDIFDGTQVEVYKFTPR